MIQTESPYYQPMPAPPEPFSNALGYFDSDLQIDCSDSSAAGCDESWSLIIRNSENIFIAGAGLYSWFQTYSQTCGKFPLFQSVYIFAKWSHIVDKLNCQNTLIYMTDNYGSVTIQNLITIGAKNMIQSDGTVVSASDNLAVNFHPYWSQITVFDPVQDTPDLCKGRSTTTTAASVPTGTFEPQMLDNDLDTQNVDTDTVYVTIVNGSPYDFILASNHTYQMDTFQFSDVPSGTLPYIPLPFGLSLTKLDIGKSVQMVIKYHDATGDSLVDDKGEAYHTIDGTDKFFAILARTNMDEPTLP
jgi:hypothetical protein